MKCSYGAVKVFHLFPPDMSTHTHIVIVKLKLN